MHPFYVIRAMGGVLYLTGGLIMALNIYMTIKGHVRQETGNYTTTPAPTAVPAE